MGKRDEPKRYQCPDCLAWDGAHAPTCWTQRRK